MDKPFLAFGGDQYYPSGGWDDFKGAFSSEEEAYDRVCSLEWFNVVDVRPVVSGSTD
jgi:hypothetical protein